jgi:uncharacterized protein (TIGR00369 family)
MTLDAELMEKRVRNNEFHDDRDYRLAEAGDGRIVLVQPMQEKLTNFSGNLHGGIIATLVDTASALAIRSTFDDPWEPGLATTDLNLSYVRPASSDARAEAEVVRVGDSLAVTTVEVTGVAPSGERKVVATGGTTYRVFD